MIKDHISRSITKSNYRVVLARASNVAQLIGVEQHKLEGLPLAHFADGILSALLLATQLKGVGVVSVEFDSDGAFDNYRCDATPLGLVRAMIPSSTFEKILKWNPQNTPLIGKGNLYISKKIEGAHQPFHSVIELISQDFTKNISNYLVKSEQINGVIALCTIVDGNKIISCDGFMIEEMPDTKKEGRDQMFEQLSKIKSPVDIFQNSPNDATVLKNILGAIDTIHMKDFEVAFFCPCTRERFLDSLSGLPRNEIENIETNNSNIITECDFCKKSYSFTQKEIFINKDSKN